MNLEVYPYVFPLVGGVLIALSSTLMLAGLGRITGISGFIAGVFNFSSPEKNWRIAFLLGLVIGGVSTYIIKPNLFAYQIEDSYLKIVLAGFLVGFGTRLGGGCTSGHGVCGLARLAKRSFTATITFILFGMLTVLVLGVN